MRGLSAACVCALGVLFGMMLTCARADGDWRDGRATFYGNDGGATIHMGSCMFWNLDQNAGTGWNIAALSDQTDDFDQSCGRCYEVKCRGATFRDGYGTEMQRDNVCYDEGKSVVVRITDACPCNYPNNAHSNRRWCCGDAFHMDLSYVAFSQLASLQWGVMGIRYRQVDCPPGTPPVQQWQLDRRNRKGDTSTY